MKNVVVGLALFSASLASAGDEWSRPRSIAFLVLDGTYDTELVGALDVLQHVVGRVEDAPKVFTVGVTNDSVRTAEGLRVVPDYGFADAPEIDMLVVASTMGSQGKDRENAELIAWIARTGRKARYVVSLCWGAFLLAEAGLLEGGPATTFPEDYDRMEQEYPNVDVKRGLSFVDAGRALTSVGGIKSYDVAMYLVESIYGREVALGIASGLLIDWDLSKVLYLRAH